MTGQIKTLSFFKWDTHKKEVFIEQVPLDKTKNNFGKTVLQVETSQGYLELQDKALKVMLKELKSQSEQDLVGTRWNLWRDILRSKEGDRDKFVGYVYNFELLGTPKKKE